MGWLDDLITIGGAAAGGGLGFLAGGPGGALAGASLGSGLGGMIGGQVDDNGAGAQAQKIAQMYDAIQYKDPQSDPQYAQEMAQLKQYSTGAMTPEDKANELEALNQAGMMAKGREGAIEQDAATKGSGVDNAGMSSVNRAVAAQDAATRLSSADVQTAGQASARGLQATNEFMRQMSMNAQMQNQFALAKAGGATQANMAYLNYLGAQEAAQQQALAGFTGGLGKMGAQYTFGAGGTPPAAAAPTDSFAGGGSPAAINSELGTGAGTPAPFSAGPPQQAGTPDANSSFLSALNGGMPVDETAQGGAPSTETTDAQKKKPGFQ